VKAEEKVKQVYPDAYYYAGRIYKKRPGTLKGRLTGLMQFSHESWAWEYAWRRIADERKGQ
jgi:hypothetical protein